MVHASFIPIPDVYESMVFPPRYYLVGHATVMVGWAIGAWLLLRRPASEGALSHVRTVLALLVAGAGALWLGSLVRTGVGLADATALSDKVVWNPNGDDVLTVWYAELWLAGAAAFGLPLAGAAAFAANRLRFGPSWSAWLQGGAVGLCAVVLTASVWLAAGDLAWRPPLAQAVAEREATRTAVNSRSNRTGVRPTPTPWIRAPAFLPIVGVPRPFTP